MNYLPQDFTQQHQHIQIPEQFSDHLKNLHHQYQQPNPEQQTHNQYLPPVSLNNINYTQPSQQPLHFMEVNLPVLPDQFEQPLESDKFAQLYLPLQQSLLNQQSIASKQVTLGKKNFFTTQSISLFMCMHHLKI